MGRESPQKDVVPVPGVTPKKGFGALCARPPERSHDGCGQDRTNHAEGRHNRQVDEGLEEHLRPDEDEYERESELEIDEFVDDARQQEIERPQSQHRADVGCVDDEGIARDRLLSHQGRHRQGGAVPR